MKCMHTAANVPSTFTEITGLFTRAKSCHVTRIIYHADYWIVCVLCIYVFQSLFQTMSYLLFNFFVVIGPVVSASDLLYR